MKEAWLTDVSTGAIDACCPIPPPLSVKQTRTAGPYTCQLHLPRNWDCNHPPWRGTDEDHRSMCMLPPHLTKENARAYWFQKPATLVWGTHFRPNRKRKFLPFDVSNVEQLIGYQWIRLVDTASRFATVPAGAQVYHALVSIDQATFLVYGYTHPTCTLNASVIEVKKNSVWRGEVAAFKLGVRGRILSSHPKKAVVDLALALFVSRVTEALDLGMELPTHISASTMAGGIV
ncbi:hypothetical protein BKA70DRAFT_1215058 [Coprinopsis sp. MPI-PUGE-AT-0042]|nr:hypothetical protein BKA70DRAFT_1215058 [Coprinopsis sp. MPI-PUGE-AT-0042]